MLEAAAEQKAVTLELATLGTSPMTSHLMHAFCNHLGSMLLNSPPCSGATQALKMVGEYFPWTSPADWQPHRQVTAGGVSDTDIQPEGSCGAVAGDADQHEPQSSHFVYLRWVGRALHQLLGTNCGGLSLMHLAKSAVFAAASC